jgi:hypothetical protein
MAFDLAPFNAHCRQCSPAPGVGLRPRLPGVLGQHHCRYQGQALKAELTIPSLSIALSASSLSLRLGLCLLGNEFQRQPRSDVEFLNRLFNCGLFVRRFNVANGDRKARPAVDDPPPVDWG